MTVGSDLGSHLLGTHAVVSLTSVKLFGRVTLLGEPIGSNDDDDSLSPCKEGSWRLYPC